MNSLIYFVKSNLQFIDLKTRRLLSISILVGLIWFALELSFVYILQSFLLSLKLIEPSKLQIPLWLPTGILQAMVLLISFGIIRALISYAKAYFSILAMHSSVKHYRTILVREGLDSKYFNSSSEYLTLFSERVNQTGIFIQYVSLAIVGVFSVSLFFCFGIFYAPYEMIFSLSLTIFLMIPIKKVTHKIQKVAEDLLDEWNQINSKVMMVKRNMFFLSVYDLVNYEKNELKDKLLNYEKHYGKFGSASSLLGALPLFVGILVLSICSYFSVEIFHTDGIKVLSFFYIFLRMIQGLSELNTNYAILKLSYPSFKDVKKSIEELEQQNTQTSKTIPVTEVTGLELSINALSFGYDKDDLLFRDLNLELKKGDKLVIKGPSGAGKSTLLKLILGLEHPLNGSINLNGQKVYDLDPSWRKKLGYVGPEPFLIPGTIKENLFFGNNSLEGLNDEKCLLALDLAGLTNDFKQSNINLQTSISEVSFLSTGQRQRLAIARAFLRSPSIMIFDEATANLDKETEEQIVKNIGEIGNERITIIVTHKNSFDVVGNKFLNIGI